MPSIWASAWSLICCLLLDHNATAVLCILDSLLRAAKEAVN